MNKADIKIPTMPPFHPPIDLPYPISPRENLMRILKHDGKPLWMPVMFGSSQMAYSPACGDMPYRMDAESEDWFGIHYAYSAVQGSPTPESKIFEDITDWHTNVKWPDMSKVDWAGAAAGFVKDPNLATMGMFGNGIFERLHIFEPFEQALVDLITEPEECRAFFERLCDYKLEMHKIMQDIYHYDYIVYNDDWATARAPFFSEDLMRDTLLEPTKRLFKGLHEMGMQVVFHCCGKMDAFAQVMIEEIGADGLEIQTEINDVQHILKTWGDKCTVECYADSYLMYDPDTTPEMARAHAREIVDKYGAHVTKGGGGVVSVSGLKTEVVHAFQDELFHYSMEKYKNL